MKKFISLIAIAALVFAIGAHTFADNGSDNNNGASVHTNNGLHLGFFERFFGNHQDQGNQGDDVQGNEDHGMGKAMMNRPVVVGKITAISGNTLTVSSLRSEDSSSTSAYTVDATNASILYHGTQSSLSNLKVGDEVVVAGTLSGTTVTATTISAGLPAVGAKMHDAIPGTVGKVTAISGSTITITTQPDSKTKTATIYTVDATNATIKKSGNTTGALSDITVGSYILAQGTVSGTTITATTISVWNSQVPGAAFPGIQNNGQPIIDGTITTISGNTVTVTSANNVTYTVDATNAKIAKANAANATVANLAVGDTVIIQGTVNGTAVVAATIVDHPVQTAVESHPGFFRALGNFFSRMFGR